jgi:hypothetical protein
MSEIPFEDTKVRIAPPKAAVMLEALRGLGYTTATALADLVDNSVSAGAATVNIDFHWAGTRSWVCISDDGRGMTDAELDIAMRIGEVNPLNRRDGSDLGRFGLGLKTASFSQARRLTVASLKSGRISRLRWDLDVLANDPRGDWALLEGTHPGSESRCAFPDGSTQGTIVLWENLDRLVTSSFMEQDFLDLIDLVDRHLGMVFHRYLDRSGLEVEIFLNGKKIRPWDPFLSAHASTWRSPEVSMGRGDLQAELQAFVLPHKDRLSDKEYLIAGGPEGWASQQGFYIYRGRRLLVAGSWLGLGRGRSWSKDESHRLARIRLDISNSADADWKIDVRKASAQPPVALRDQLTRLAEDTRDRARRVFLHRAIANTSLGRDQATSPVWISEETVSGRRYRIDRNHPAVSPFAEDGEELKKRVEVLLRVLEETVPVRRIWLEAAETGEHAKGGFTSANEESVREVLRVLYKNLVTKKGFSSQAAKQQLLKTEPFDLHPDLVTNLPDDISLV